MAEKDDINPAVGGMLRAAREMLSHEHSVFRALNLEPLMLGVGRSRFALDLPADFASDGSIHSGMLSMVLDSIMGMTVFTALKEIKPIATINLKTDYLRAAPAGGRVVCHADCHAMRDDVAYVRGAIAAPDDAYEIAVAIGAFMIGTRAREKGSRL